MTNEERLEERLIDAHNRGYYNNVMTMIKDLKQTYPKKSAYELYDLACNECKRNWLDNNKIKD